MAACRRHHLLGYNHPTQYPGHRPRQNQHRLGKLSFHDKEQHYFMKPICFLLLLATTLSAGAQNPDSALEKKAASWVASLQLNDAAKETRLSVLIATHLTRVRDWNNEHPYTTIPAGIDPATGKPLST